MTGYDINLQNSLEQVLHLHATAHKLTKSMQGAHSLKRTFDINKDI